MWCYLRPTALIYVAWFGEVRTAGSGAYKSTRGDKRAGWVCGLNKGHRKIADWQLRRIKGRNYVIWASITVIIDCRKLGGGNARFAIALPTALVGYRGPYLLQRAIREHHSGSQWRPA